MKIKSSVAVACFLPGRAKDLPAPCIIYIITNTVQTLAYSYVHTSVIWCVMLSEQQNPGLVIDTMNGRRAGQQNCRLIPARDKKNFLLSKTFGLAVRPSQSHIQWAPGVFFRH
jgi:hypothetical protein